LQNISASSAKAPSEPVGQCPFFVKPVHTFAFLYHHVAALQCDRALFKKIAKKLSKAHQKRALYIKVMHYVT
jgi:hypothetical protein